MKKTMRVFLSLLLVVLVSATGLFADTKEIKGKDFVIKIEGGKLIFILSREGSKASIPGFFNGWKPTAEVAQMTKKDGKFYYEVSVEKFAASKPYEFKFYVDGNWDPDPNRSLNLKKKNGEWVFAVSPTAKIKPNSPSSASIMFTGRFTSWFPVQMNVKNAEWNSGGDDGMYITDTMHNFDLDTQYKIGDMVLGFARLKLNYQESGERGLFLDSLSTDFMSDDVRLTAFYKKRIAALELDNPSQILRRLIDTAYNGISFYGESNYKDLYDFGRNFAGVAFKSDSLMNIQVMIARYVDSTYDTKQNDVVAVRLKPLKTKSMHFGLFWVYNANQDYWPVTVAFQHNGNRYANYLRENYLSGFYNHVLGGDFVMNLGTLTVFAEGFLLRTQGTAGNILTVDDSAVNNIAALGGIKFKSGNLLVQALGQYFMMDDSDASIMFGSVKGRLSIGKKGFIAASFDIRMPGSGDATWSQRAEFRIETSYFDFWGLQAFKTLSYDTDVYTRAELTVGIDYYLNSRLVVLAGVYFVNDANETFPRTAFTTFTPLFGVKYSFSKNISFSLFYGRELDYDSYLEDNNRTVLSAIGWNTGLLGGSSPLTEKSVSKMHRITLKADLTF